MTFPVSPKTTKLYRLTAPAGLWQDGTSVQWLTEAEVIYYTDLGYELETVSFYNPKGERNRG